MWFIWLVTNFENAALVRLHFFCFIITQSFHPEQSRRAQSSSTILFPTILFSPILSLFVPRTLNEKSLRLRLD